MAYSPNLAVRFRSSSSRSAAVLGTLQRISEAYLAGPYRIEIIDLMIMPQLAAGDQIFAVPTPARRLPEPIKKIIDEINVDSFAPLLLGLGILLGPSRAIWSIYSARIAQGWLQFMGRIHVGCDG
ncbi:MAG: circadian clock KaiB family protein [Nitrospirota bacterium]